MPAAANQPAAPLGFSFASNTVTTMGRRNRSKVAKAAQAARKPEEGEGAAVDPVSRHIAIHKDWAAVAVGPSWRVVDFRSASAARLKCNGCSMPTHE